ncbi:MAG: hypothetical protein V2I67_13005, partial [Thermoanaerobaculales bacterium]|nr:hypothetical protein [Thermoanaerobaculales bacterium]
MKLTPALLMIAVLILGAAPLSADHHPPIEELAAMRATDPSALLPILDRLLAEIELDTDELQLSRPLAGLQMTLGDISRQEGNLSEAVAYYETAMNDAVGVVPSVVSALHEKLAEIKAELGDTESALHHLQALMALREESHERERQSIVEELEVRYKVEQRERQLEVMTLDARLQEAQLRPRFHHL